MLLLGHGGTSGELDGDVDGTDRVCRKVDRCGVGDGGCGWLSGSGVLFGFVNLDLAIG